MDRNTRRFASSLAGIAALTASAASLACSLVPANPERIKQLMAGEIAHRLGIAAARIPLSAISPPQLHTPFPLGADCSGLGAYHHSAGFRWSVTERSGLGPLPSSPERPPAVESAGAVDRMPPGSAALAPAPRLCSYEGVAVVMGFDYSSPVAVHFAQRCR